MSKKSIKIPRVSKAEVYKSISNIINGINCEKIPPFISKYYMTSPSPGIFKALREKEKELVEYVPAEEVAKDIMHYITKTLSKNPNYSLTEKECIAAANYWLMATKPVAEPKNFTWPEEEGLSFSKLPWKAEEGPHPTWDSILNRMSNSEAFCDWIGSLFIDDSSLQDYCWLYGQGNDGKGCINNFLADIFCDAYASKQPPEGKSGFWLYGLLSKRIVVFPDCNNRSFITSGLFKAMTGGDPVDVEKKGEMSYTARLRAKYLFLSNEKPDISSERADLRRIIYCEFNSPGIYEIDFEKKLWSEGGAFVGRCIKGYLSRYSCRRPIAGDSLEAEILAAQNENEFQSFFDENFLPAFPQFATWEGLKDQKPEFIRQNTIRAGQLNSILKQVFSSRNDRKNFIEWLTRQYGARYNEQKVGGVKDRFYSGFYIKPSIGSSKFINSSSILVP